MANTQAMCTSFMSELMLGQHQFGTSTLVSRVSLTAPTTDTFKAALFLASATLNASTTAYSTTGEAVGTNYSPGGINVTNATSPTSTNSSVTAGVAYWTPSASLTYGSGGSPVTLATAFDTVLIYNSTQSGKAVSVHTFGSQTITAGTFTLTMPTNNTTTALLRLATT
jgi:hypothetical protein